jgi:hypothetical protein
MSSALELLKEIRRKPGLYLSRPSVRDLANIIEGYQIALHDCGVSIDDKFSLDFQPWIQRKFSVDLTQRWDKIIESASENEPEAMKRFWELLDEFLGVASMCEPVAKSKSSSAVA